ncbi:MAG TPA: endo-1,3-alpha-glucanase family glycosylhydrolase [Spirillospora sp.]|nr:endo-1,3-alpha-glucanase family glycosylhydrolase [Spirillospora sp.]
MRKFFIFGLFLSLALLTVSSATAQTENRQVYAFYFGWWTNESWNDGRLTDKPAQLYDSRDAGAVGRHIDQAKSAGIDAFIMSWYGPKNGNLTHQVFNMLLDQASARGFRAAAAVDMFDPNYNGTSAEVLDTLRYLIGDRVNHPAYLRYAGKPVIYFWNQGRFSVSDWASIRSQVDPDRNTIWVMEGTNTSYLQVFDGLYLFNTAWSSNPAGTASAWFANTRAAGGWFYTPTVLPGWDESRMEGRSNPTSPQSRSEGQFLTTSWNGAAASGAGVILIVSWNEYFENSHIEPSQQHGSQALDTLRPLIANWKAGGPVSVQAPASTGGETAAPSGPAVTVLRPNVFSLNVRGAPSLDGPVLGQVGVDDVFAVEGEAEGWYKISFNGQEGWVSADYVGVFQQQAPAAAGGSGSAGAPSGATYTTNYRVSLRGGPGESFPRLDTLPYLAVVQVIGRTADSQWVQVEYNGQTGWVSTELGNISVSVQTLTVTG